MNKELESKINEHGFFETAKSICDDIFATTYESRSQNPNIQYLAILLDEILELGQIADDMNEWIPVSERLPKEKGYYLVTRKNPKGHVTRVRFDPNQVERGVYNSPWGKGDADVLAWMPLPMPYKGDTDD